MTGDFPDWDAIKPIFLILFTRANKNVIYNLVPFIHDPFSQILWGRDIKDIIRFGNKPLSNISTRFLTL